MSYLKYSKKGASKLVVKNPTRKQLKKKESDAKRPLKNRDYINAEIERRGGCCEFCGAVHYPQVFQWHHIDDEDPDKVPISQLASRASFERLDREFKKCVVLCPTCHHSFHQNLSCMFEHREQHINGTYNTPKEEDEGTKSIPEVSVENSILRFIK